MPRIVKHQWESSAPAGHGKISLFRTASAQYSDENLFPPEKLRPETWLVMIPLLAVPLMVPWFLPLKIQTIKTHSHRWRLEVTCYFFSVISGNVG